MKPVTVQEVIDCLDYGDRMMCNQMVGRIRAHGIQQDYVPMSIEELEMVADPQYFTSRIRKGYPHLTVQAARYVEKAVLNRLGVAPTLDQANAQPSCEPTAWLDVGKLVVGGMVYATSAKVTEKQKPLYERPASLDQAKAICEQAGFAVVKKKKPCVASCQRFDPDGGACDCQ